MGRKYTGAQIRQTYIDFFQEHTHTYVPSMSLVPGDDATLLFTNAGMVQFKDIFLGIEKRPYTRAVNSQKCMRVAGKHNDLDDVGRDDTHHTFFEMLGNWSFGDYYKKEAIEWAWQLLTDVWELPRDRMWVTCFKDDQGSVPTDIEAATFWGDQPGMNPEHILFFGRKDNFWEMADIGPCGPCSEIHFDRGESYCNLNDIPHNCAVNGDCTRYLELWNLVFIQYNRLGPDKLEPLPATHVDTGMGFERIVSVLQDVDSNYKTDLFSPTIEAIRSLTGKSLESVYSNFTPYRVVADHARAASFLIADGVVPGNTGRNYICRMIIRRAARFGSKIGLTKPFLESIADSIISTYGDFYIELKKHRQAILDNLRREEVRFARTVESGTGVLDNLLKNLRQAGKQVLSGSAAFDLYATYGLPLEIARDIAREQGMDVEEVGFRIALEEHRLASGAGQAMGTMGGEDVEKFRELTRILREQGKLGENGVHYDPYDSKLLEVPILAIYTGNEFVDEVFPGDEVEIILPQTNFYVESGGQVSDTGTIMAKPNQKGEISWSIEIVGMRKPSANLAVHVGYVRYGNPRVNEIAHAQINLERRRDIMRNHTATHLLHTALHQVLGDMARQAGSLVAPDRLRFDFTHPDAMSQEQIEKVEKIVNDLVRADFPVVPIITSRENAIAEGAMALFGEKYDETVRTITISDSEQKYSYELCGGTHLERTSDLGVFLIVGESSAAAGIRRIEAVTGRAAYELIKRNFKALIHSSILLTTSPESLPLKIEGLKNEISENRRQIASLKLQLAVSSFETRLEHLESFRGISLLQIILPELDKDTLGKLADQYREKYPVNGICIIASPIKDTVNVMATVTLDLIKKGIKAGELVSYISQLLGGGGGGAPHLAFGGGKEIEKVNSAMEAVHQWLELKLGIIK